MVARRGRTILCALAHPAGLVAAARNGRREIDADFNSATHHRPDRATDELQTTLSCTAGFSVLGRFFLCEVRLAGLWLPRCHLVQSRSQDAGKFLPATRRQNRLGGVLLIFTPWLLPFHGRFGATFFDSLQAVGFTLLLLQSLLHPERRFYRALNWRWVRHVGVLSYSIYIWQQLFWRSDESVFGVTQAWWLRFPLWLVLALLAAHASYYLLEKPLLKLRARFHTA